MKVAATSQKVIKKSECRHEWAEIFDADADAACYNDGFNYRPAEEICTQCGKTRKIKYEDETKWYKILLLSPFLLVAVLYLGIVAPILTLIIAIKDELITGRKG